MKKIIIALLFISGAAYSQIPKLGSTLAEINRFVDGIKYPVEFDSIMFDKPDIEGNELVQSYSIKNFFFYGKEGTLRIAFDRKGKSTLNGFEADGTIADTKSLRDSISLLYNKPKKSYESDDIYRYSWREKPTHALSLREGQIKYFQFKN